MKETVLHIKSRALRNERSAWMFSPEKDGEISNLVVFLDAEIYLKHLNAREIIEKLARRRGGDYCCFVFVSMHSQEARLRECACHPPFAQFIGVELMEFLGGANPALKRAAQSTLVGVSFSGLAAAFVAKERPGVFQKVIAQSGSFWWRKSWLVKEFAKMEKPLPTKFLLDVGRLETEVDAEGDPEEDTFQSTSQIDDVKNLRDALISKGCMVKYVEFDGGHEAKEWEKTLPDALKWATGEPSGNIRG